VASWGGLSRAESSWSLQEDPQNTQIKDNKRKAAERAEKAIRFYLVARGQGIDKGYVTDTGTTLLSESELELM